MSNPKGRIRYGRPRDTQTQSRYEEYEAAETEFLEAVGLCITQWAFVDRQLFRLFNFGLEAKRSRSAAIYYRQNSLDQRLKLTTNILRTHLPTVNLKSVGSHFWLNSKN